MNVTTHERPGVYSVYGASSLVRGSGGRKTVGLAVINTKAKAGVIQTITSYEGAVSAFGSQADSQDMAELIRVLLLNGAAAVAAIPVANAEGYEAAFAALAEMENISVVVCDSTDQEVQQKLRDSVTAASAARRERIAVVAGGAEESVTALTDRAKALNSERVVLAAPGGVSAEGTALSGLTAATARNRGPGRSGGPTGRRGASGAEWAVRPVRRQRHRPAGPGRCDATGQYRRDGLCGPGDHHQDPLRRERGRNLEGAVHSADRGRRDPGYSGEPAGPLPPGEKHGAEPGGHPVPGGAGAGEQKIPGDHHRLRWRNGVRPPGEPHGMPGGVRLYSGPRAEPDLADSQHHHLRRQEGVH